MPRVHHVKKARKDYPNSGIKKGDSYYWWKFNFGAKYKSLTSPRPSQLTQSDFLGQFYDLQEDFQNIILETVEELKDRVDEVKDDLQTLSDEQEERREAMPEHLQDTSSAGEILQERHDGLEEIIGELDSMDFDVEPEKGQTEMEKAAELTEQVTEALYSPGF